MATNNLGITAYYHDSAACLIRDGDVVAASQEERFTKKYLLKCPGSLKKTLLLIHVDDDAEAINHVVDENNQSEGRVFYLSHKGTTQEEYFNECVRKRGYEKIHVLCIPFWVANFTAKILRVLHIISLRIPIIHNRLAYLYRDVRSHNGPIGSLIGWALGKNLLRNILWRFMAKSSTLTQGDRPPSARIS